MGYPGFIDDISNIVGLLLGSPMCKPISSRNLLLQIDNKITLQVRSSVAVKPFHSTSQTATLLLDIKQEKGDVCMIHHIAPTTYIPQGHPKSEPSHDPVVLLSKSHTHPAVM